MRAAGMTETPWGSTLGYCVDLQHGIGGGDCEPQSVQPSYGCEVTYILNNFYPNGPVTLLETADEAATVQSALSHFTDCFTLTGVTGPDGDAVVDRYNQIIAWPATTRIRTATTRSCRMPRSTISRTTQVTRSRPPYWTTTATRCRGAPSPSRCRAVRRDRTPSAAPRTRTGSARITYTNQTAVPGPDSIQATTSFSVPVGLEFSDGFHQRIVLAGQPRTGTITGLATRNWVTAASGDGVINQGTEECDDGNLVSGDGCDSNCTPTACGNGITTQGEQCDDHNTVDGDGCSATCQLQDICTDLIDNDNDGRIDCDDPDCKCQVFGKDPAAIIFFRPTKPDQDYFKVHGRMVVQDLAAALSGKFGILVTNANGVIYKGLLLPGDLKPKDPGAIFSDKTASKGPGT